MQGERALKILKDDQREIRVAKSAGFCFGVRRAVEGLLSLTQESGGGEVFTYGPIIHNETVIKDFENRGVQLVHEDEPLPVPMPGIKSFMALRSHGVTRAAIEKIEKAGFEVRDLTCPFVSKIQAIVSEYSEKGFHIVITGDEHHPEVIGIMGWTDPKNVSVVKSADDVQKLDLSKETKICVVSQTTFRADLFKKLVEMLIQKGYDTYAQNTICSATSLRQSEAKELSKWADVMLVIGGKNSSNSAKLFDICRENCEKTFFLQGADDLKVSELNSIRCIGITAGASTPDKIIEEVFKKCQTT